MLGLRRRPDGDHIRLLEGPRVIDGMKDRQRHCIIVQKSPLPSWRPNCLVQLTFTSRRRLGSSTDAIRLRRRDVKDIFR